MVIEEKEKFPTRTYFGNWYERDEEDLIAYARKIIPCMQFPLEKSIHIFNTVWCKGYVLTIEKYKEGGAL